MNFSFRLFSKKRPANRIHLDYASTTPIDPGVFSVMQPYFAELWANPSALYKEGVRARQVIEEKRTSLARVLRVRPHDITFTSGGTEANNLAVIGLLEKKHDEGRAYESMEVITSRIEHPSVTEAVRALEKRGVRVTYVPVSPEGRIDIRSLEMLLNEKTVLVSCAYVNSEIGVVQDIKKISRIVRKWNDAHGEHTIFVHTDACQAPLWLSCELDMLGVDMLTLDAGKCYGPKGVGVLVRRHWVPLAPMLVGGGQEEGMRSGTENVPLIVGCVEALIRAQTAYKERSERVSMVREYCFDALFVQIPGVVVNGSREHRVANNVNISIPGVDTEYATIWLDTKGIAVSTKSACGTGKGGGSVVVREISHDEPRALATLRITLGEDSRKDEIDIAVSTLKEHVAMMIPRDV